MQILTVYLLVLYASENAPTGLYILGFWVFLFGWLFGVFFCKSGISHFFEENCFLEKKGTSIPQAKLALKRLFWATFFLQFNLQICYHLRQGKHGSIFYTYRNISCAQAIIHIRFYFQGALKRSCEKVLIRNNPLTETSQLLGSEPINPKPVGTVDDVDVACTLPSEEPSPMFLRVY